MIFNGSRSRGRDFVIRIALLHCFRSHFVYCFPCLFIKWYISPGSIIAVVGPLCTATARIPWINAERVLRYF